MLYEALFPRAIRRFTEERLDPGGVDDLVHENVGVNSQLEQIRCGSGVTGERDRPIVAVEAECVRRIDRPVVDERCSDSDSLSVRPGGPE